MTAAGVPGAATTGAGRPLTARLVQTARGPVEAAVDGAGPLVVLVHGMPGDWRQARAIAELLLADCSVALISRPGYGRTPLRSGRSIDDQARLVGALLDVLDVERATLVGISGGGPSCAAFARLLPERTAGLVLVSAVCPEVLDIPPVMRRAAAVPGLWESLSVPSRLWATRRVRRGVDVTAGLTPAEIAALDLHATTRDTLRTYLVERPSVLRGPGLRNDITQCWAARHRPPGHAETAPATVVLHGDADEVVPVAHAHEHVRRFPGARLELFPGWGHGLPLIAADRVAAAARRLAHG